MNSPDKYFLFLNRLRESGETNIWGAASYLVKYTGLTKRRAETKLLEWMRWVESAPSNRDL